MPERSEARRCDGIEIVKRKANASAYGRIMHILLFNEYYPPDTSATAKMAAQVAETLAQRHKVTVVAGRPSYDPDEYYPFALLRRDTRNNVNVERVGSTAYPRHKMRRACRTIFRIWRSRFRGLWRCARTWCWR